MTALVYPLKQVLEVKIRRVEEQEKVVLEKRRLLEEAELKLKQRKEERDRVEEHYKSKLQQMRQELDQGTTTDKIQQMKAYLKVVQENLKIEEKKVKEQEDQVQLAKNNLEVALKELAQKRIEVDKLQIHKKDWTKALKKELEQKEEQEFNEQGSVTFLVNKKRRERL